MSSGEYIPFDPTTAIDAGLGEDMRRGFMDGERAKTRLAEIKVKRDEQLDAIRLEPDLLVRAKNLVAGNFVNWPEWKNNQNTHTALNCDKNRMYAFELLFGRAEGRPHIDTFRGRLVDWRGEIVDDHYSVVNLLDALLIMGLRTQSARTIRASLREFGLAVKTNDLQERFARTLPEWDGVSRLESKLIALFGCFDTELNRKFGMYFWLSIYCRVTSPGCIAPMVLSLFGAQNVGKSYFGKLICRVLIGDDKSDAVQLNMGSNPVDFLRSITGNSIVANIGEMTGFSRTDLNAIKQLITATSDDMHYKYEGNFRQQRQWIVIMDGNKYEGLQRDDTGNRRFYPMFVGQLPDKDGQPHWRQDFKANFFGFETELWQIMAECRAWLSGNGGIDGYTQYVDKVSEQVKAFSEGEMLAGRGAVKDSTLDTYLTLALNDLSQLKSLILTGRTNKGVWISTAAIAARIKMLSRGEPIKDNQLKARMAILGAEPVKYQDVRGYLFRDVMDAGSYEKLIRGDCDGQDEVPPFTIDPSDFGAGF